MLISDGFEEYDGFYFDDISVIQILPGGLSVNENLTGSFAINVYPNPAVNQITFSTTVKSESDLLISDAAGRQIENLKIEKGIRQLQLNIEGYENGIYFYALKNAEGLVARGTFSILK